MSSNTSTLHQRRLRSNTTMVQDREQVQSSSSSSNEITITSSTLLKSNPTYHSKIYKLKIPFMYRITPTFLLAAIYYGTYPLLSICNVCNICNVKLRLWPYWVERYCIVIGNYLYKFQPNENGNGNGNGPDGTKNMKMKMKGSPIPLEQMTLSPLLHLSPSGIVVSSANAEADMDIDISMIPANIHCKGYFAIESSSNTKTKTCYYATETQLDAQTWINVLHNARQECITQKLGHSKKPTDRNVEYLNKMAKKIIHGKERISNLIKRREMEEVELTCLHGSGTFSGMPRGYYG